MSISQNRYVDITTIYSGADKVPAKELIGRFFTSSQFLKVGEIVDFETLDAVLERFGSASSEYEIASKYFGFVSKAMKSPKKISFANFNKTARACKIENRKEIVSLATLKDITDGSINLTMGGISSDVTGINLSSCTTYSDISTAIQTAIRAVENGEMWTNASVTFDANKGFALIGGIVGAGVIDFAKDAETGTSLADLLGWSKSQNPFMSDGSDAETPVEAITRTTGESNNFGSFAFIDDLSLSEVQAVANWTNSQNVKYIYSVGVTSSNYSDIQSAVDGLDGVSITYGNNSKVAYMPMAIMASIDYSSVNGSVNFMFTQFANEDASVTTDVEANEFDGKKINYYGQTQTFGSKIAFYQRGFLQGEFSDMGCFANEIWLKSAIEAECLSMLLARKKVPANETGKALLRSVLQGIIEKALNNGTISAGKTLSTAQKVAITELTNDDAVIAIIEQVGYWLNIEIEKVSVLGNEEYHLKYTLIYSKGDSIRKVVGYDIVL